MEARTIGWAGVELRSSSTIVVDPLADAAAVWAAAGDLARDTALPALAAPEAGRAAAGLLTHLHRDHADAEALAAALRPGAPVFVPQSYGGGEVEQYAVAQAEAELRASGLTVTEVPAWETVEVD